MRTLRKRVGGGGKLLEKGLEGADNGKYSGQETLFLPKEGFAMTLFLPGFCVRRNLCGAHERTSEASEQCSWGLGGALSSPVGARGEASENFLILHPKIGHLGNI